MFDADLSFAMQRSRGSASVHLDLRRGQTRLVDLHQSGSAKAMLPRVAGIVPEVVFLNTSGGLTGDDALCYDINLGPGAHVTATTQTAERGYASTGAAARVQVRAQVAKGARLDWLPQEMLLYENAHVIRDTTIDLDLAASCLVVETVVLGRHAMGEDPTAARLTDHRMVRRCGRPFWAETIRIDDQFLSDARGSALLGTARAFSVIALVADGAEDAVSAVRSVLSEPDCEAAASGWNGKCLIRVLARDGWPLRRQVARVLEVLRGRPVPRVWQMQGDWG